MILPPVSYNEEVLSRVKEIAIKVAKAFEITGPYNVLKCFRQTYTECCSDTLNRCR